VIFPACLYSQQTQLSVASDINLLRSFKDEQEYWAVGQTVTAHFHFTPKDGAYVWIAYTADGRFMRDHDATAKTPTTTPQVVTYSNRARISYRHISMGWKHYLLGAANKSERGSLYAYAGFGLMLGRVLNTHSVILDTTNYDVPVLSGKGNFKRLTGDLGIGYDRQLGGDIYGYIEGRALVPMSTYPTSYILNSKYAPLTGSVSIGIRVLFE
jgi:hypothetical protein